MSNGKLIKRVGGWAGLLSIASLLLWLLFLFHTAKRLELSNHQEILESFLLAALMTTLIFIGMLLLFLRFTKRHLWDPLLVVMEDMESLGRPGGALELRKTGSPEFDRLVEQVNLAFSRLREQSTELFEAQYRLQETEIQRQRSLVISLKKQINSHFTVNVLNNIKLLAMQGKTEQAGEMSDGLSFLLRYANAGDEFIDGMEELFILEKYINIMNIRSPGKFTVEVDWDDMLSEISMPRMLVQPLLENAITHGFSSVTQGGIINLAGAVEGEQVVITVTDNGRGMDEETRFALLKKIHQAELPIWSVSGLSHIALPNIQRRVYSYYGAGYGLSIDSRLGEGTVITLRFPTHCSIE